ncbi:MAG: hypothetical protein ACYDC1_10945, partial [Limisphaerales bacterium]
NWPVRETIDERFSPVAANWHSPLLSERRQVHGTEKVTGERQFAATLMGGEAVAGGPCSFPVAANWHSPLLSERWQVHGTEKVTGEQQFAATRTRASRRPDCLAVWGWSKKS